MTTPYGFIYITTNHVNGKKYIGQTKFRKNLSPGYLGSGKYIKEAIDKHGRENFSKEIVFIAFSKDDLDWAEREIIYSHDAVNSRLFYNIAPGGRSSLGFTGKKHSISRNAALSAKMISSSPPKIAKAVIIDGVRYPSLHQASEKTGYSLRAIKQFIKSGIHPTAQYKRKRGEPKTYKIWFFVNEAGSTVEIRQFYNWCKSHHVTVKRMLKTETTGFYLGLKFCGVSYSSITLTAQDRIE